MFDLDTLKAMNKEAVEEASSVGREPFVLETGWSKFVPPFPFPVVGDYVPDGWELLEDPAPLFCDSSGWDAPDEPALTVVQLIAELNKLRTDNPDYGYAIIEEGQFQLSLGVFKRTSDKPSAVP